LGYAALGDMVSAIHRGRKMKRVLHFIGSLEMGGTENMLLLYLKNTKSKNLEHSVCTLYSGGALEKEFQSAGIKVYCLGIKGKFSLPIAIARFKKLVEELHPNIIHSYLLQENLVARLVGKLTNTKVICGKRDTDRHKSRWKVALDLSTMGMAELHVSNSREGANELTAYGLPHQKIKYIPNGKDLKKFDLPIGKIEAKKRIGCSENEILLGCIARLYEFKGQKYLIQALPSVLGKYPKAKIVLVGGGSMEESLQELAKSLGVEEKVLFLGERKDIPELLKAFDLFVFPSLREGMPGALMEAMASGLPVIATNIDGNNELIVDGENGVLVSPERPQQISAKIILLLENKEMAERLGEKAKETIEKKFSIDNMVTQIDSLYERF